MKKFNQKSLVVALCALIVTSASATSKPSLPQSYGTSTPTTPATTTTTAPTTSTNTDTHTHGGTTTTGSENKSETCEIAQVSTDFMSDKINETIEQGALMGDLIENFKKSPVTQNCLAGFSEILDLSSIIPVVNTGGFDGGALKQVVQEGVKKAIQAQKEKIKNEVCAMADTALTGALSHLQSEVKKVQDVLDTNVQDTIEGYLNTQIGDANKVIDNNLNAHIGKLNDRLEALNEQVSNIKPLEGQISEIAGQIDDYANKATADKTTATPTAPTATPVPTPNTQTQTAPAPTGTANNTAKSVAIPTAPAPTTSAPGPAPSANTNTNSTNTNVAKPTGY